MFECPACSGGGCADCDDSGRWNLVACPLEFAGRDLWSILDAADLARRGTWPVGGGWLDQAAWLVAAVRFCWTEERRARRETTKQE